MMRHVVYRIQLSVTPDTLIVERVGHRDGFYER
jgi:hypothetical protein